MCGGSCGFLRGWSGTTRGQAYSTTLAAAPGSWRRLRSRSQDEDRVSPAGPRSLPPGRDSDNLLPNTGLVRAPTTRRRARPLLICRSESQGVLICVEPTGPGAVGRGLRDGAGIGAYVAVRHNNEEPARSAVLLTPPAQAPAAAVAETEAVVNGTSAGRRTRTRRQPRRCRQPRRRRRRRQRRRSAPPRRLPSSAVSLRRLSATRRARP